MLNKIHPYFPVLGGLFLGLSWPHTGSLTILVFPGFLLLFLALLRQAENKKTRLFTYLQFSLAFFIWNLWATHWLFYVQGDLQTRFISAFMPSFINTNLMALPFVMVRNLFLDSRPRLQLTALVILWLSFEYLHLHWELSWPWLNLGNVFAAQTNWIQWYEFTGCFGGSLWILLFAFVGAMMLKAPLQTAKPLISLVAIVLIPITLSFLLPNPKSTLKNQSEVLIVQPNLDPYSEKFKVDPFQQLEAELELVEANLSKQTDLVLFPETDLQEGSRFGNDAYGNPLPEGMWEENLGLCQSIIRLHAFRKKYPQTNILTGAASTALITRSDQIPIEARPITGTNWHYLSYNTALWMDDSIPQVYHKSKLVPAAEILPYASIIKPILGDAILTFGGASASLSTQEERTVFFNLDSSISCAPVICYESIYGAYLGNYILKGAKLICVMTNDGWWGTSAGHKQHLAYAKLRAIEHRKAVIRSANTGISAYINTRGEIVDLIPYGTQGTLSCKVDLEEGLSFYTLHGDYLYFWGILMFILLGTIPSAFWPSPVKNWS